MKVDAIHTSHSHSHDHVHHHGYQQHQHQTHPLLNFSDRHPDALHNYHHGGGGYGNHHQNLDQDIDDDLDDDDDKMDTQENGRNAKAETRKSNKPIMEKRRRARINNCLNDLKGILLEAMRKDPARHSKLEKADILELTVRHLQNVQRNQLAIAMATDPTVLLRFKNGFSECATEVSRYMGKMDSVDSGVRQRLSGHLGSCVNGLQQVGPFSGPQPRYSPLAGIPFVQPSPKTIPIPIVDKSPLAAARPGIQQQLPNNAAQLSMPSLTGDVNNNNSFLTQSQSQAGIPAAQEIRNSHPAAIPVQIVEQNGNISMSAFSAVTARRVHAESPQESPLLMSPPSSNDHPNVSVSLSSGSDSSSCAGSTPTSSLSSRLSPLDFSLKIKDKESSRAVRVLKVEPMVIYDDLNSSMSKGSMWRPW